MTPVNADALEPAPKGMGEFSRIIGVFFEPKKTFADIAERPRWIVPMVVLIVFTLAYSVVAVQHVGMDRLIRQGMENNPRMAQMTHEQRDQAMAMGAKIGSVTTYAGPIIGIPVVFLIESAVLLGIVAGIMSAPVKFKQVLAVLCYAGMTGVVFSILATVVVFLKNPDDFNIRSPLAFNAGAFMDPQSGSKFLYSLAGSIDLFSFWGILLIATGLKAAAGKKLSFGGALFAVILPWGVFVLGRAALAGAGLGG